MGVFSALNNLIVKPLYFNLLLSKELYRNLNIDLGALLMFPSFALVGIMNGMLDCYQIFYCSKNRSTLKKIGSRALLHRKYFKIVYIERRRQYKLQNLF